MPAFADLIQQGAGHAWLFVPSAILLGALHGLEPGHSKTMMAAFIVAIRGTVGQAVLLGLAATVSHTLVVWGVALGGMYLWGRAETEAIEPYLQIVSAAMIVGLALWMIQRTWSEQRRARDAAGDRHHGHEHHDHGHEHHGHGHGHGHQHHGQGHAGPAAHRIETPNRTMAVDIVARNGTYHWCIRSERGKPWDAREITVTAERPDGSTSRFTFRPAADGLESVETVPRPHTFRVHVSRAHEQHAHDYDFVFDEHADERGGRGDGARRIDTGHGVVAVEIFEDGVPPRWRIWSEKGDEWAAGDVTVTTERPDGASQKFAFARRGRFLESVAAIPEPHEFMARISLGHGGHVHDYDLPYLEGAGHDHLHEEVRGLNVATGDYQDAHELAHANDIRRRFADRDVTTWQIVVFGLTGGLLPCPAAITVLLLCLQLKEITLGAALVLCFSIGLALTLVAVGALAALSVRHVAGRWSWFGTLARRAPYASGIMIIALGIYVGIQGWLGLTAA